jgi:hypothetical protein
MGATIRDITQADKAVRLSHDISIKRPRKARIRRSVRKCPILRRVRPLRRLLRRGVRGLGVGSLVTPLRAFAVCAPRAGGYADIAGTGQPHKDADQKAVGTCPQDGARSGCHT